MIGLKAAWAWVPLPWKIGAGIFIVGAICWGVRMWANAQYYKGVEEGRNLATTEIAKKKEAEWQDREKRIAEAGMKVSSEQAALESSRKAITQTLYEIKANANAGKATISGQVASVPVNELIPTIRALSAELGPPATNK